MIDLRHGDCLELMKDIPDNSIDMVLTDPPYGTTACKWDSVIPFEPMWKELKRITKDNGAICLFGSEPFSSHLRLSNLDNYKYDWVWRKNRPANINCGKIRPLKYTEEIMVFSNSKKELYYPVMMDKHPSGVKRTKHGQDKKEKRIIEFGEHNSSKTKFVQDYSKMSLDKVYPRNILEFPRQNKTVHPTQKPVALLEYLIKTYTLENENVLDFTMGSGSTGVAAKNLNRKFIGIEQDAKYFQIAKDRINLGES